MPVQRNQLDIESIQHRKPARRMIEIPEPVMQALSEGFVATMNLVEWLASDRKRLLASILERIDLKLDANSQPLLHPSFYPNPL